MEIRALLHDHVKTCQHFISEHLPSSPYLHKKALHLQTSERWGAGVETQKSPTPHISSLRKDMESSFAEGCRASLQKYTSGSFAEIQGSFAEIEGSFAEIRGSFAET